MKTKILTCLLLVSFLFGKATNKIVVANSGQGWSNGNNFSPAGLPQNGDSVTIPAGVTLTVKGNIYGSMSLLKIYIYGTMDFDPSGKLDLTVSSLVQIYSGGKITTNGSSSEIISMGGVVKYNGQNDGTVTGPKYASAATSISNGIADDAGFNFGVLPLNVLSFALQNASNEVVLNWNLNLQAGIREYVVQRKKRNDWEDVQYWKLPNSAAPTASNSFIDRWPAKGENFYRLKLIYTDGRIEYSKILATRVRYEAGLVSIYPNPVKTRATITFNKDVERGRLSVFNVAGLQVYGEELRDGLNKTEIDFAGLPKGLYYITISDGTVVINKSTVIFSPY